MSAIEEYTRILNSQPYMALATSVEGVPNVRVVDYFPDLYQPNASVTVNPVDAALKILFSE